MANSSGFLADLRLKTTNQKKIMEKTEDSKSLLQSKTALGAAIVIASQISQMAGWDIGNTDGLAEQIATLFGGFLTIYGRIKAFKRIR